MFLLKGHEDLRQDERVMQFFSLVNSLLVNDPEVSLHDSENPRNSLNFDCSKLRTSKPSFQFPLIHSEFASSAKKDELNKFISFLDTET